MHALRHFYASVLLDAGESIKALSEYLGHSDPGLTVPDCISVCQSALTGGTERSCVTWSPKAPCSGSRV
jgi:hypothetical protein